MVAHSAGYKHDYLSTAMKVLTNLSKNSDQFKVITTMECNLLNDVDLKKYDAFLFATTGELPITEEKKQEFIAAIKKGTAFIGVHNATDTFYEFAEYGEMLGGYFKAHPWNQEIIVKVEDKKHPATRHLPDSFKVKEEVYTFKQWNRDRTHVLISLDNSSIDINKGTREDNDYSLCWCHNYGVGRVFYTGFGHFNELWHEEWFQTHLLNGILWAMKLKD